MKRIRHPVAKSIVSLVALFLVWKIAVAVLESLGDAQYFTLLSYSNFITQNIPFQNLEKIVAQANCRNSTEILQYLLDNGMIGERLLVLDDNVPKCYRWQITDEVRNLKV